jgi:nucleoside-diphosphate-sugar epimerase
MPSCRVLVTGAFGNIGSGTLRALLERGDVPVCFDTRNALNQKTAKRFPECETVWGDICDEQTIAPALEAVDAVIHLAAMIPPHSEANPRRARAVNVEGTRNLVRAIERSGACRRILFASSIAVHGIRPDDAGVLQPDTALAPVDHYSHHKVECEEMIQSSGLDWTILRISVCPPISASKGFKDAAASFDMAPDEKLEFCHPADIGLAMGNAAASNQTIGKVLLLGGGERCRFSAYEFVSRYLEAAGIGRLPISAYTTARTIPLGWVDTRESQALLSYQRHTLDDLLEELKKELGVKRMAARLLAPLLRRRMLQLSPYYDS